MEKRVTLLELISYVLSITNYNTNKEDSNANKEEDDTSSTDTKYVYSLNSTNNRLEDTCFRILKNEDIKTVADLPKKLKSIFDPFISDIKRCGILKSVNDLSKYKKDNVTENLSLLNSILCCFKKDYWDLSDEDKILCATKLNTKLINDIRTEGLFTKYNYKDIGWMKKELVGAIKDYKNNLMVLRLLSEYFSVNIFLLNVNEDKIYAIYPEESFNIFKSSIFLSFYNDVFEPLSYKNDYVWSYDCEPLKKLINVDKAYIGILNVDFSKKKDKDDKYFQTGTDDLDKYLPEEEKKEEEDVKEVKVEVTDKEEGKEDDNTFDEVYPTTTTIVDNFDEEDVDDIDCTETEIDTLEVKQEVFCTSTRKSKLKSKSKSESKSKSKPKPKTPLDDLSMSTMKLPELQKIAEEYEVNINSSKTTKSGKSILKTKAVLYKELIKFA